MLVGDHTLVHGSVSLLRSEDDYSVIKHFVIGRRKIWGENKLVLAPKVFKRDWGQLSHGLLQYTTVQKFQVSKICIKY